MNTKITELRHITCHLADAFIFTLHYMSFRRRCYPKRLTISAFNLEYKLRTTRIQKVTFPQHSRTTKELFKCHWSANLCFNPDIVGLKPQRFTINAFNHECKQDNTNKESNMSLTHHSTQLPVNVEAFHIRYIATHHQTWNHRDFFVFLCTWRTTCVTTPRDWFLEPCKHHQGTWPASWCLLSTVFHVELELFEL